MNLNRRKSGVWNAKEVLATESSSLGEEWTLHYTEEGVPYYYNSSTEESRWAESTEKENIPAPSESENTSSTDETPIENEDQTNNEPALQHSRSHPSYTRTKSFSRSQRSKSLKDVIPTNIKEDLQKQKEEKVIQKKEGQAMNTMGELVSTERTFISDLEETIEHFMKPMRELSRNQSIESGRYQITEQDIDDIFGNIGEILELHQKIFQKLGYSMGTMGARTSASGEDVAKAMAEVFIEMADEFQIYTKYSMNKSASDAALARCNSVPEFTNLVSNQRKYVNQLELADFLIKPVQRICKYPLFLRGLLNLYPSVKPLEVALTKVEWAVKMVNAANAKLDNIKRLAELDQQIEGFNEKINVSGRKLIKYAPVTEISHPSSTDGHERCLFLFNDMIICTRVKNAKKKQYTFKYKILLLSASVAQLPNVSGGSAGFQVIHHSTTNKVYYFLCSSVEGRNAWVEVIHSRVTKIYKHQNRKTKTFHTAFDQLALQQHQAMEGTSFETLRADMDAISNRLQEETNSRQQLESTVKAMVAKVEALEASQKEKETHAAKLEATITKMEEELQSLKGLLQDSSSDSDVNHPLKPVRSTENISNGNADVLRRQKLKPPVPRLSKLGKHDDEDANKSSSSTKFATVSKSEFRSRRSLFEQS